MLQGFRQPGKASFVIGGQWGSEGKGAACAFTAWHLHNRDEYFDIVTTNAGAQAGHTSTHKGVTRVTFHLPTYPLITADCLHPVKPLVYLNAGAVIDVQVLLKELDDYGELLGEFFIHPNAAIITDACKLAEMGRDSAQTKIASTRKGVGEAIARRALRSGMIAKDVPQLRPYILRIDLNSRLAVGVSVLVEVPQGFSLSLGGKFYPYCTSRNCTIGQAMSDADIHPSFCGETMMVIRTFPIRVGNIEENGETLGKSGDHYPDQGEISWEDLGVKAEITTVTKRVRRVFTFSRQQLIDAMLGLRPSVVYLTFCDYFDSADPVIYLRREIMAVANIVGIKEPEIILQYGPSTDDVRSEP